MNPSSFKIGDVPVGLDQSLFLLAGPCVIEDEAPVPDDCGVSAEAA